MSYANTEATRKHLKEISDAVARGAHALVILDPAGRHTMRKLQIPKNLTMSSPRPVVSGAQRGGEHLATLAPDLFSNRVLKNFFEDIESLLTRR
jgi:hypothetical protein